VVAIVNGEEITIPEVNAEARARGLTIGGDTELRNRLVGELIERKLLVQSARNQKLDRTPEYLLSQRRSDEILLSQQLLVANSGSERDLTPQELNAVAKANPFAFDSRILVEVDQITILPALTPQLSHALTAAASIADAAKLLGSKGIPYTRRLEQWDSAGLQSSVTKQLVSAKSGTVLLIPGAQGTVALQVRAIVQRPTDASEREDVARELLRTQRTQLALQSLVQGARSSAKIRYQPGFQPSGDRP
jgi:EpsD family peptidyl-prolyl cis-trans isomerase